MQELEDSVAINLAVNAHIRECPSQYRWDLAVSHRPAGEPPFYQPAA
ncbi:MAG: hypothetical protein R3F42_04295 [Pseudomonadota bacterium]